MAVSIGRRGWLGVAFQASKDVPVAPTEYIPWDTDTLMQKTEQMPVTDAHGLRDSNFNSVPGKQSSEGQLKILAYPNFVGYLLGATLGSYATTTVTAGVYSHGFSENESNTPQYLNFINNRVVDQEYYPNVAVSSLDLEVGIDIATLDAKLVGDIAFTTTSGNFATVSGNIWSFKQADFGWGSSIANAMASTIRTTSVKLNIENGTEALWAHGSVRPYAIVHKDIKVTADIELYFENTTDKTNFYNQVKQAAVLQFTGNPLGSNTGFSEQLTINLYQITFKTMTIDTGLDNFQLEKITVSGEFSVPDGKTISATLVNGDNSY